VLVVLDQAYFEYIDDPDYADGIEEHFKAGRRVAVLRTFSKITDLRACASAGCARRRRRRRERCGVLEVTATAQAAALASMGDKAEIARRRAANAEGRPARAGSAGHGPVWPVRLGNFLYVEVGDGRAPSAALRQGMIVRPLSGFGAPEAIRISVGTEVENGLFAAALGHVLSGVTS
jgi:histidinol-phosphate aminotransferase